MTVTQLPETTMDRFLDPLYTVVEAARYLKVPTSTFRSWARGYRYSPVGRPEVVGAPIVTSLAPSRPRGPVVPFVGLAEGMVLAAIRSSGVPLQRIRPALATLDRQLGLDHVLATRRLYTDGAEVLYDFAQRDSGADEAAALGQLVVARNGQQVFNEVVERYLSRIEFGDDGYARLLRLPAYETADIIVDPRRGFGQPIFARGGARLEDALSLFRAGEPLTEVAEEYGIPADQLEDALRVALPVAA